MLCDDTFATLLEFDVLSEYLESICCLFI